MEGRGDASLGSHVGPNEKGKQSQPTEEMQRHEFTLLWTKGNPIHKPVSAQNGKAHVLTWLSSPRQKLQQKNQKGVKNPRKIAQKTKQKKNYGWLSFKVTKETNQIVSIRNGDKMLFGAPSRRMGFHSGGILLWKQFFCMASQLPWPKNWTREEPGVLIWIRMRNQWVVRTVRQGGGTRVNMYIPGLNQKKRELYLYRSFLYFVFVLCYLYRYIVQLSGIQKSKTSHPEISKWFMIINITIMKN